MINRLGRHNPVTKMSQVTSNFNIIDTKALEAVFINNRNSQLMEIIANVKINSTLRQCCLEKKEKLFVDGVAICAKTLASYQDWLRERRNRITGTTCYSLLTYIKNKKPDWRKKCNSLFDISNFKSQYTEYGKEMEKEALQMYRENTGHEVLQTGLIICQKNPWLAFSPDGIIFKEGKPHALLEIKCPFKGKNMNIDSAIRQEFGKCLEFCDNNISLKKKHKYYGQVQLGMAIIGLQKSFFFHLRFV